MMDWKPETYDANTLVTEIKNKIIQVPPYQRGQVWDSKTEKKFIDSVKKGFPFGSFLLFKSPEKTLHLIDGLQRSTALARYISNPAKYASYEDIPEEVIEELFNLLQVVGDIKQIKEDIRKIVNSWIKSHSSMEELVGMQYYDCYRMLVDQFPTLEGKQDKVTQIIKPALDEYRKSCQQILGAKIPIIIYEGKASNLPEIFVRLNKEGMSLNKYQILAASWSELMITVGPNFDFILHSVREFFDQIRIENFEVASYDPVRLMRDRKINLYQLIFGFGKLLKNEFPNLFGVLKSSTEPDSCGFTLINACFGNRNKEIELIRTSFDQLKTDEAINKFLTRIIESCKVVNNLVGGFNAFKLNSRYIPKPLHTELQICSMVANVFIARYSIVNENINGSNYVQYTESENRNWRQFLEEFKKNAISHYVSDIINNNWTAHGDARLDDVIVQPKYYTDKISEELMANDLLHWHNINRDKRKEHKKVPSAKNPERLILSLIYSTKMPAIQHLDGSKYDIEHLAPKNLLKQHLNNFPGEGLPISLISNLALLPYYENRSKKDKTIYGDQKYRNAVSSKLAELEKDYTFTKKKDLSWIENPPQDFEILQRNYFNFLNNRFERLMPIIISAIYRNN